MTKPWLLTLCGGDEVTAASISPEDLQLLAEDLTLLVDEMTDDGSTLVELAATSALELRRRTGGHITEYLDCLRVHKVAIRAEDGGVEWVPRSAGASIHNVPRIQHPERSYTLAWMDRRGAGHLAITSDPEKAEADLRTRFRRHEAATLHWGDNAGPVVGEALLGPEGWTWWMEPIR